MSVALVEGGSGDACMEDAASKPLMNSSWAVYLKITLILLFLAEPIATYGQDTNARFESALGTPKEIGSSYLGRREVLEKVSTVFELPMLIVVPQSDGVFEIPAGRHSAREILNGIVQRNPQYDWERCDSAVYFYQKTLRDNPKNFLNWKAKEIRISGDLAIFKLYLASKLARVTDPSVPIEPDQGGLLVGITPERLMKHKLPSVVLHDVTISEALCKVLSLDRRFYISINFPNAKTITKEDIDSALFNWHWTPFEDGQK
jgi:hypothetical protein